ncbi:hypothetical protein HF078_16315 [Bacillus sp. RO2]|nr:hypothetical protein [Bacillus sp. RO2]
MGEKTSGFFGVENGSVTFVLSSVKKRWNFEKFGQLIGVVWTFFAGCSAN